MKRNIELLLVTVMVLLTVHGSSALRCHECDSWASDWCIDGLQDDHAQSCGEPLSGTSEAVCVKADLVSSVGGRITYRACNYLGQTSCTYVNNLASGLGLHIEYCGICTTDTCNVGTSQLATVSTLVIVLVVVLFSQRLYDLDS